MDGDTVAWVLRSLADTAEHYKRAEKNILLRGGGIGDTIHPETLNGRSSSKEKEKTLSLPGNPPDLKI